MRCNVPKEQSAQQENRRPRGRAKESLWDSTTVTAPKLTVCSFQIKRNKIVITPDVYFLDKIEDTDLTPDVDTLRRTP